jgi:hypothetical protein
MNIWQLVVLLLIAGLCGAIAQAIVGADLGARSWISGRVAFVKERHSGGPGPLWCGSSPLVGQPAGGNQAGRTAWRVPAHPPSPSGLAGVLKQ